MGAESWLPNLLQRVEAACGWGYGGRVSACALTQGKVDISLFLCRTE